MDNFDIRKFIVENRVSEEKFKETQYFRSFSDAVKYAKEDAEKRGFTIDEDDWWQQIATGPGRPGKEETRRFVIGLSKGGKEQKKALTIVVYGMPSGRYELVHYIN